MLENKKMGRIVGVNGNLLTVEFDTSVTQNEVAYVLVGDSRLKCEVIRVRGSRADLQIFESSAGLKVGDSVEFTNALLSVKLGPGLLTQVYDGLQNPLEREKLLDLARWRKIEEFEFGNRFNFNVLCAYKLKLELLLKWKARDAGQSQKNLDLAAEEVRKEAV